MLGRKLILMAFSTLLLFCGAITPIGRYWLNTYILDPENSFITQWSKTSVEERKAYRYGNLYILCQLITNTLQSNKIDPDKVLILFPPNRYLTDCGVTVFSMPDPSTFYCLTHIKSVWTTSPDVQQANWVLLPGGNNSITLKPIKTDADRNQVLASFSKYTPSL